MTTRRLTHDLTPPLPCPGRCRAGCRLRHGPFARASAAHRLRPRQRRHAPRSGRRRSGASSPTAGRASGCMPSTCPIRWRATTTPSRSRAAPRPPSTWPTSRPRSTRCCKATGARQGGAGGQLARRQRDPQLHPERRRRQRPSATPSWAARPTTASGRCTGCREGNEFSGTGPFLTALNAPKNAAGDEVAGPVQVADDPLGQQRQVRAARRPVDRREGHADQRHLRRPGAQGRDQRRDRRASTIARLRSRRRPSRPPTASSPAARRRTLDDSARSSASCSAARSAAWALSSADPASGNFANNLPLPGARLEVFAIDPATGERRGAPGVQHRPSARTGAGGRSPPSRAPLRIRRRARPATPRRTSIAARSRAPATSCTCAPSALRRPTRTRRPS